MKTFILLLLVVVNIVINVYIILKNTKKSPSPSPSPSQSPSQSQSPSPSPSQSQISNVSQKLNNPFVGTFISPYKPGTTPIYSITFTDNNKVIFNQELIDLCKRNYYNFDYYASNLRYESIKVNDAMYLCYIYSNDGVKTVNISKQVLELGSDLLYLNNQYTSEITFRKTVHIE